MHLFVLSVCTHGLYALLPHLPLFSYLLQSLFLGAIVRLPLGGWSVSVTVYILKSSPWTL